MQAKGIKAFSGFRDHRDTLIIRIMILLICLLLAACSTTRTVVIDSSRPARIDNADSGCVICETTPCTLKFTRKPFQFFDSSTGFMLVKAILPDGKSKATIIPYRGTKR